MSYGDSESVEAGLKFKTRAGLVVETTGVSLKVEVHNINVHEVVIVEGAGEGSKYLIHLDYAEQV